MVSNDNKQFWEKCAKFYGPIQERSNRKLYHELAQSCESFVEDVSVLEIACGTGQLTAPLAPLAQSWIATDFSERMVSETSKNCPNIQTEIQDVTCLTYPDESFDLVLIGNALHIMPDPQTALREIKRVLKPGGILLAPTFVYEGKVNRIRMALTTAVGFKSFYEWTLGEFTDCIREPGFIVIYEELIPGDPLPEAFVAAKKPA